MLKFNRINSETGVEYIGEFNASHHWSFAAPESEPTKLLNRIANDLIVKWNMQQPKNWQYSRVNS